MDQGSTAEEIPENQAAPSAKGPPTIDIPSLSFSLISSLASSTTSSSSSSGYSPVPTPPSISNPGRFAANQNYAAGLRHGRLSLQRDPANSSMAITSFNQQPCRPINISTNSDPAEIVRNLFSEITRIERLIANSKYLAADRDQVLWLHGHMCEVIVSNYRHARQKLSQKLETSLRALISPIDEASSTTKRPAISPEQFLQSVRPSIDNLAIAMREGQIFVDWCRCNRSLRTDMDLAWLQKAVVGGLSSEPAESHLHDLVVSFCAVSDAVSVDNLQEEKILELMHNSGSTSKTRKKCAKMVSLKLPLLPQAFWRKDQNGNSEEDACLLLQGICLDEARSSDLDEINQNLQSIRSRLRSMSISDTENAAASDKMFLASLMEEKIHYLQQQDDMLRISNLHTQQNLAMGDSRLLLIPERMYGNYDDLEDMGIIFPPYAMHHLATGDAFFGNLIRKVKWRPCGTQEFVLKEYCGRAKEYFNREAPVHLRFHHPNVVQSVCVFRKRGVRGLLMEYMDMNLREYLEQDGDLRLVEKVYIMLQIAKGMEYIHSKNVIHRDLKLDNVLVKQNVSINGRDRHANRPVQIKISDFNTAKLDKVTHHTPLVGTTFYRAPEVLQENDAGSYSFEVDVYSFAVVCSKILASGSASFSDNRRPDLSDPSNGCPPYLRYYIETWWEPDPAKRPRFEEICRVLRHLYGALLRSAAIFNMSIPENEHMTVMLPSFLNLSNRDGLRGAREHGRKRMQDMEGWINHQLSSGLRLGQQVNEYGFCRFSKVDEVPYEMHVYSAVIRTTEFLLLIPKKSWFKSLFTSRTPIVPGNASAFG